MQGLCRGIETEPARRVVRALFGGQTELEAGDWTATKLAMIFEVVRTLLAD